MKRLLLQLAVFCVLVLLLLTALVFRAGGNTDDYYNKFASSPPENLIFGTSKASQAMQPKIFKEVLGKDFFNYAFTLAHSPYGPIYLESIKHKVKPGTTNGTFILTVDPWSISTISSTPNDPNKFYEFQHCLVDMKHVNLHPNVFYLWKHYSFKWYELAFGRETNVFVHKDGWLEVDISMEPKGVAWLLKRKIMDYSEKRRPLYNYSSLRVEYLKETIEWLNERGDVYLVHLPVHDKLYEIGDDLVPQFDSLMYALEPMTEGYYNMTPDSADYRYVDGNHIYRESGKLASRRVAEFVLKQSERKTVKQ